MKLKFALGRRRASRPSLPCLHITHITHIHYSCFTDHFTGRARIGFALHINPEKFHFQVNLKWEFWHGRFTIFTNPCPVWFCQYLLSAPPDLSSALMIVRLRATWPHVSPPMVLRSQFLGFFFSVRCLCRVSPLPSMVNLRHLVHTWSLIHLCTWTGLCNDFAPDLVPIQICMFSMSSLFCGVDTELREYVFYTLCSGTQLWA
jgi:hypothetical protein